MRGSVVILYPGGQLPWRKRNALTTPKIAPMSSQMRDCSRAAARPPRLRTNPSARKVTDSAANTRVTLTGDHCSADSSSC